jgi:hypothetical protein
MWPCLRAMGSGERATSDTTKPGVPPVRLFAVMLIVFRPNADPVGRGTTSDGPSATPGSTASAAARPALDPAAQAAARAGEVGAKGRVSR